MRSVPGTILDPIWGSISLAAFLPCEIGNFVSVHDEPALAVGGKMSRDSGTELPSAGVMDSVVFPLSDRRLILRREQSVQYFFAASFVHGLERSCWRFFWLAPPRLSRCGHWPGRIVAGLMTSLVRIAVGGGRHGMGSAWSLVGR